MFISKSKKSPFFQITYEVNGKRTTVSTKTRNIKEAYKFMANFTIPNKSMCHDLNESHKQNNSILLLKFKDEYVEHITPTKSISYVRSVRLSFKMLIEFTGDILLNNLEPQIIDKFITHTFARAPRGASLYYRTLKAAFSKAVLWNYIQDNPFKKIKSPKVSKSFPVFISEAELQIILIKTKEKYLRDLFFIAFYTGMRLGELVNMKLSWIDLDNSQITVHCSDGFITKSKKERIIPMNHSLANFFRNRLPKVLSTKNEDYVFTRVAGIKLNEDFVSKKFKEAVRIAQLDDKIHFHSLRHSFASLLVQRGISLYVVKELLGHEDLTTTQIYSHLQQQNLKDAVNLL